MEIDGNRYDHHRTARKINEESPTSERHRRSTSRSRQNEFKELTPYLLTIDQKLDNLKTDVGESTSSNKSTTSRLSRSYRTLAP